MMRFIRQRISLKLFFSYSLVVLVNVVILAVIANLVIPRFFSQHMLSMDSQMNSMMGNMDGTMMGDLFLNFRAIFFESLLVGVVIAFIIVIVVSAVFSQRFVAPLREMMMVSQRIAQGRFHERVSLPKDVPADGMDEIGQLAVSFNTMAEKLEQIEEMRGRLIGDISHELRTPMNAIIGLSDLALRTELTTKQQDYIDKVYSSANSLLRLINDILDFSKIEAGKFDLDNTIFSLRERVGDVVNMALNTV